MERFAHKLFNYNQPKCGTHIVTMCTRPATGERSLVNDLSLEYRGPRIIQTALR